MLSNLTPEQVRTLAPDPSAARSGEGLAGRRHWSATGRGPAAAWGLCKGSGKDPYQVIIDIGGPAFKCSCPSRKFPCKHALGLMFLTATDPTAVPKTAEAPPWAAEWLASRQARAEKAEARAATEPREVDAAARDKRIQARERKVDAGIGDLDRWLQDLVRRGLAAARGEGYGLWDQAAARLVDAQAASLGREVRTLGAITNSGSAWAEAALERIARLHLICEAYRRQDTLPGDLRADVRSLVGWTLKEDDLPADRAVADRWLVLGRAVTGDERLTTARTWLLGERTGRFALHLAFGAGGATPVPVAMPGASFDGTVTYYPSATPLRVGRLEAAAATGSFDSLPVGGEIGDAASTFAGILATNPFVLSWPVILRDVVPVGRGDTLVLRDAEGAAARATPAAVGARLLALAGGHAVSVFGLWSGRSIRIVSALADGRLVDLDTEQDAGDSEAPVPARGGEHDPWGRLVSAALLGTERTETPDVALPEPVAAIANRPTEQRLMGAAAVLGTLRRAGWAPTPAGEADVAVEPAPPDERHGVSPGAAWLLRRALEERPELIAEWLDAANGLGRRPPHEELPGLLALAARNDEVRDGLRPMLGNRARWLVTQLPNLAPGVASALDDPDVAFERAAGAAARAAVIREVRAVDAARGRGLVAEGWDDATVEERVKALDALATGLSSDDLPLIETASADRRIEVRSAAQDLLARLPDTPFARTAERLARPLLATVGRLRPGLEATRPAWDDDFDALGIIRRPPHGIGEQAWWLRQLIARVRPSRWQEWLKADPTALVERALRSDEAAALVGGWAEAAQRFGDGRWSAALLGQPQVARGETGAEIDPVPLLQTIDPAERATLVGRLVPKVETARAARLVSACPRPWSRELTRTVAATLEKAGASGWPDQGYYDLLRLCARRADPALAEEVETRLFADERRRLFGPVVDAVDTLRFRHQIFSTLATTPGGQP